MDIDRSIHPNPLLVSANGAVYPLGPDKRFLVGFLGTWMGLDLDQLASLGNTLGRMLHCPCRARHFEDGLLLRSPEGEHRMKLDEETAREFHGLVNDLLLLAEAAAVAEEAFAP